MPRSDHPADLALEAENRRRRRMGLSPVEQLEQWPWVEEFQKLNDSMINLALKQWATSWPAPAPVGRAIVEMSQLWFEPADTPGMRAVLMERAVGLLAVVRAEVARAEGTREPGEDG